MSRQKHTPLRTILFFTTLIATLFLPHAHAGCSNLIGSVVINEINHHNQACDYSYTHDVFVELRALDLSVVNSAKFTDFTMSVCAVYPEVEDSSSKPRCYSGNPAVGYGTGLNGATGTNPEIIYEPALTYANAENSGNPWIVLYGDAGRIPKCYLDVNTDQGGTSHGMELVVYDKNGDIIDYQLTDDMNDFSGVSTPGYLGNGGCTFSYDNYFDGANSFNVQRMPDGTGCWPDGNWSSDTCIGTPTKPPSGNSATETTNTTNDTLPAGTTAVPLIIIDDISVAPGGSATFTLSIYGYYNLTTEAIDTSRTTNEWATPINITYMTLDGTATQPGDYTPVASSIGTYAAIPAGAGSTTITVATNDTATVDEYFNVLLTAVLTSTTAPAIIYDFIGTATFSQPIDHYAIGHSGSGVTCEAEAVTITAHDGGHLATAPSPSTTITLATTSANAGTESWSLKSGNGTFTAPNHYTFDGTETAVEFWYSQTTVESGIDIDITDGAASDIDGDTIEDPAISFSSAALRFYNNDGVTVNQGINNQIGGKPSSTAPASNALTLRAVVTDSDTGACAAGIVGSRTVKLAYSCVNPASCSGNQLKLLGNSSYNDATATIIQGNDNGSPLLYSDVTLTFDGGGSADLSLLYNSVGQLNLSATATLAADPATTPPSNAATLSGNSGNFIIRPFGFLVGASGNPAATDAAGAAWIAAGSDFTVSATAVLWSAADDSNNDGIPDGHDDGDPSNNANLSDNTVAAAYGSESTGTTVTLDATLADPAGGHNPGLSSSGGSTDITGFSGGSGSNATLQFDEVGIIDITALNASYLGSGEAVYGSSGYVGRFTAYDFALSLTGADFTPANGAFTYLGQDFGYGIPPDLSLTARSANGTTLQNYQGAYWKLGTQIAATADITACSGNCYQYSDNVGGSSGLSAPVTPLLFSDFIDTAAVAGSATLSALHSSASFRYTKPVTPVAPFDADVKLALSLTDSDGATGVTSQENIGFALPYESDAAAPFNTSNDTLLRYGRATLADTTAAGTATGTTANVSLLLEFFDGTSFVANTLDTTTTVDHSSGVPALSCSDPDTSGDTLACATVTIADATVTPGGTFDLTLANDINEGGGTLVYTLLNSVLPGYLLFDWDGDGTLEPTDQASASVTFAPPSYYHGDRRFIYWREQNR